MNRRALVALVTCAACGPIGPTPDDASESPSVPSEASVHATPEESQGGQELPDTAIRMPIEVLGLVGAESHPTATRTLTLELDPSERPAALHLAVNNIVEPGMATLSINGVVIDLSGPDGPFIRSAGGVATGTITLPEHVLVQGENALEFAYVRQVPDVSGFRVLDLAVTVGDVDVSVPTLWTDPATWTADAPQEALERGRRFFVDESRDGGPACAVCHADSGVDLAYFGFSNTSIVARAMLHEFDRSEAEDIAHYIRSLGTAVGTPFDGPFQPGAANHASAGAGWDQTVTDEELGRLVVGDNPASLPWDVAASLDPFQIEGTVQTPTWFRWLPRRIEAEWFAMRDGDLAIKLEELRARPSVETADAFMESAVELGKQLILESDDHAGRIELLRYAATKLWAHALAEGFDGPDRGFPTAGPSFPYEVGFAFFEAARDGVMGRDGWGQTRTWWWAQVAVNTGRGSASADRPLNWEDVLFAAEADGAGPNELLYFHLLGSYEDSLGQRADEFGTQRGPVRLLAVPLRNVPPVTAVLVWKRYLERERAEVETGTPFDPNYYAVLSEAWRTTCSDLTSAQRAELLALTTDHSWEILSSCNSDI